MGQERFDRLCAMLPPGTTILGVDEQVTCILDFAADECRVFGPGDVTILADGKTTLHGSGEHFPIAELRAVGSRQ